MQRKILVLLAFVAACSEGKVRNRQVPSNLDQSVVVPSNRVGVTGQDGVPDGPGTVSQIDEALQVPTFTWADELSPEVLAQRAAMTPENAAKAYLADYAARFRLDPAIAASTRVVNTHDLGSGPLIVQLTRDAQVTSYDGETRTAEVFRDQVQLVMGRDKKLVAISGYLTPQAQTTIGGARFKFAQSPESALAFALTDLSGDAFGEQDFSLVGDTAGLYAKYALAGSGGVRFASDARVKLVVFPLADGMQPAYYLELDTKVGSDDLGFAYVISGLDGKVLFRQNLGSDAHSYRVFTTEDGFPLDSPLGDQTPHPTGFSTAAAPKDQAASRLISRESGPISTNDPWLAAGATKLAGNNAYAFGNVRPAADDKDDTDGFQEGDIDVDPTSPDTFDRERSPSLAANTTEQVKAATTNLFYVVNFLHDWYYDAGFTEKDGNAQLSNYDRGGEEGDPIMAQAQDSSGRNNANMSTPADGKSPTMRMFLFDHPFPVTLTFSNALAAVKVKNSAFGPQSYSLPIAGVRLAKDDTAPFDDGCTGLVNGESVAGKIVLIRRGSCNFGVKALNAQLAGAAGLILLNNQAEIIVPGGDVKDITIPTVMIDKDTGDALVAALGEGQGITAKLELKPGIDRDGTLDTLVVAHEWGHYISNRLNHNAMGLSTQQARGLGEGWADFHALLLTVKESDLALPNNENFSGAYGLSAYAAAAFYGDEGAFYAGMRRTPYSTNTEINPLTLKHIQAKVALPALARGYNFGLDGASNFSDTHNIGELWAQMLWECYSSLLNDTSKGLTFAEKQDTMKKLLVAAYKITAAAPTILEARDAVLAAALATDPSYYEMFWKAFAKRGAGLRSIAPAKASTDGSGVVESFKIGADLTVVSARLKDAQELCTADGIFDNGETATLEITVKNTGIGSVSPFAIVSSPTSGLLIAGGGFAQFGPIGPMQTAKATVQVTGDTLAPIARVDLQITSTDPSLALPAQTKTLSFMANFDVKENASATDDVEAPRSAWTASHGTGGKLTQPDDWTRLPMSVENTVWYGNDVGTTADLYLASPAFTVASDKDFVLTWSQAYALENAQNDDGSWTFFDGAVIELSTDGTTWTDVGDKADPTYNAELVKEESDNPLGGRKAWSGISAGFPALAPATLNLGKTYAGQTIYIRFRVGSDQGARFAGLLIDDIKVAGATNTPFTKRVPNSTQSCPQ